MEEAKKKFGGHLSFSGVKTLSGGPRWLDQAAAAATKIAEECTHVILHDAARPAVPYSDIDALMESAEKHAAVSLATPCRTMLAEVDEGGTPMAFHPPGRFMQMLMPQAFSKVKFVEWASSKREHACNRHLHCCGGSPLNIRVGAGDAAMVKTMLGMLPKAKVQASLQPLPGGIVVESRS